MITTVFFDIGGVLLSNGWGHLSRQKAAKKFNKPYDKLLVEIEKQKQMTVSN